MQVYDGGGEKSCKDEIRAAVYSTTEYFNKKSISLTLFREELYPLRLSDGLKPCLNSWHPSGTVALRRSQKPTQADSFISPKGEAISLFHENLRFLRSLRCFAMTLIKSTIS